MTDYRSLKEALDHITPDNKCPTCDSKQLDFYGNFPTMDVYPPTNTQGIKCLSCGWNTVFSWQHEINIGTTTRHEQNED